MKLIVRFKKLTIWNKIAVLGGTASIIGLIVLFWPTKESVNIRYKNLNNSPIQNIQNSSNSQQTIQNIYNINTPSTDIEKPINKGITKAKMKRELQNTDIALDDICRKGLQEVAGIRENALRRGKGGHIAQESFDKVDEICRNIDKEIRTLDKKTENILFEINETKIEEAEFLSEENTYYQAIKEKAKSIKKELNKKNAEALKSMGIKIYDR